MHPPTAASMTWRSWPLCSATLAEAIGQSDSLSVVRADDLPHDRHEDPMARLVWRIHVDAHDSGGKRTRAFDACYRVEFDHYGAVGDPTRVTCPDKATPITPPPPPKRDVPPEFGPALEATLGALPAPPVDPTTGLAGVPPQVHVHVRGGEVGCGRSPGATSGRWRSRAPPEAALDGS